MKTFMILAAMLLAPSVALADSPKLFTGFNFSTAFEGNKVTYNGDFTQPQIVVLPSLFSEWSCLRIPVTTENGEAIGSFMCSDKGFAKGASVTYAGCNTSKKDFDASHNKIIATDDIGKYHVFYFNVLCETTNYPSKKKK